MIKIIVLCVIIAFGYVHCISMNTSNSTDLSANLSPIHAQRTDLKKPEGMKFLSFNLSQPTNNHVDERPNDMNEYYSWLHFLKTSTSTQVNNITMG